MRSLLIALLVLTSGAALRRAQPHHSAERGRTGSTISFQGDGHRQTRASSSRSCPKGAREGAYFSLRVRDRHG